MVKSRRSKSQVRTRRSSRKSRGVRKSSSRRSQSRKQKGGSGKRKLNAFFKKMMDAKKSNASQFSYNNNTYVRKQNARGMVFYAKK